MCARELKMLAIYGFTPEDTQPYHKIDRRGSSMVGNGSRKRDFVLPTAM